MRNKILILALSLVFFAGAVPVLAISDEQQNKEASFDIPPDTPEYFARRYERFLGLKGDKQLRKLAEQLNKFARERDKLESTQTKLNRDVFELELDKQLEKTQDVKDRRRAEKDIVKKNQELDKVRTKLDRLTLKITALKEQINPLIDKFWAERDTDPITPENEEKQRIDQLIDNIANERFFTTPGVFGLSFRTNGGFRGDMAHVYLLHGEPNAVDSVEGDRFVNLMLWVYVDERDGDILYAFLFYQKGSQEAFTLFSQDAYKLDPCGAINEIRTFGQFSGRMGECAPDTEQILQELQTASGKGGVIDGYIFAWALFNFSQDGSITQGKALEAPKPASELAKQSKARVTGEAPERVGTAGTDYILASCDVCNSLIPAELSLGERFTISAPWKNFDWTVKGEQLELSIKYRIILKSRNGGKPIVFEDVAVMSVKKNSFDKNPDIIVIVDLLDSAQVVAIPAGTYLVSVYIKSPLKPAKYNAWVREFVK